jgi:hypothetical protein
MVVAVALGNTLSLFAMAHMRVGQDVIDGVSSVAGPGRGAVWFLARSSVGYLSQVILTTLAVSLPASGITLLSLASKIVGAVATTLTNAVMPILVHQSTQSITAAKKFLRLMEGGLVVIGLLATPIAALIDRRYLTAAVLISIWLMASSAAAVAQRASFRFLPARAASTVMATTLVILGITVALTASPGFDVTVLLCAYAALDAATAALLLWQLRDRAASIGAFIALAGLASIAAASLA